MRDVLLARDGAFWRAIFSKRRAIFVVWRAGARFSKLDGVSNLTIVGEVRTIFYRNDTPLYFQGLVVRNMESEVLWYAIPNCK